MVFGDRPLFPVEVCEFRRRWRADVAVRRKPELPDGLKLPLVIRLHGMGKIYLDFLYDLLLCIAQQPRELVIVAEGDSRLVIVVFFVGVYFVALFLWSSFLSLCSAIRSNSSILPKKSA